LPRGTICTIFMGFLLGFGGRVETSRAITDALCRCRRNQGGPRTRLGFTGPGCAASFAQGEVFGQPADIFTRYGQPAGVIRVCDPARDRARKSEMRT
jgi:hypothetical protein